MISIAVTITTETYLVPNPGQALTFVFELTARLDRSVVELATGRAGRQSSSASAVVVARVGVCLCGLRCG